MHQGLRTCRPALVRGYESMVMARLLLQSPGCEGDILARWEALLQETLQVCFALQADCSSQCECSLLANGA